MEFQLVWSCAEKVAWRSFSRSRFPAAGILPLGVLLANYERKGIRITPKSIIMDKNIINNSKKTWCKMDVSTPPSLDLACPQAKTELEKHVHML